MDDAEGNQLAADQDRAAEAWAQHYRGSADSSEASSSPASRSRVGGDRDHRDQFKFRVENAESVEADEQKRDQLSHSASSPGSRREFRLNVSSPNDQGFQPRADNFIGQVSKVIESKQAGPSSAQKKRKQEDVDAPVYGFENRLLNQIANKERLRPHTGVIRSNKPKVLHIVEPLLSGSSERSSQAKISVGELEIRDSLPIAVGTSQPDVDGLEAGHGGYGRTISTQDEPAAGAGRALRGSAKDYSTQLGKSLADTRCGTDTRPSTQITQLGQRRD